MTTSTQEDESKPLPKLLYIHTPHPHQAANVNKLHAAEQRESGINARLAVRLTKIIATMYAAYTFGVLAIVGLLAILGVLPPMGAVLVAWTSQTLIQLCMLPIIMVGQSIIGRKQELLAEETFATTRKNDHELRELQRHQNAQDEALSEVLELVRAAIRPPQIIDASGLTKKDVEDALRTAIMGPQPSMTTAPQPSISLTKQPPRRGSSARSKS
jgi:hypothetical protein